MGSRAGEIRLDWGGESRTFRLGLGELRKIQEETGAGPTGFAVRCKLSGSAIVAIQAGDIGTLGRIGNGPFAEPQHVRFVLLQGLLGAGVPMSEAMGLIKTWVDDCELAPNLLAAYEVCMASILGPEDEPLGEVAGEGAKPSPKDGSTSETTTAPELSQG